MVDSADKSVEASHGGFDLPILPAFPPLIRCLNSCYNRQTAQAHDDLVNIVHSDPALLFKAGQFLRHTADKPEGFKALREKLASLAPTTLLAISRWALAWQHAHQTPLLNESGYYLWSRSLYHAYIGRFLAEKMGQYSSEEGYALGLFLEVGRLDFLKQSQGTYIKEVLSLSVEDRLTYEQETFGHTFATHGAMLIGEWSSASFLADAIRYQNATLEQVAGADPLIRIGVLIPMLAASLYGDGSIPFAEAKQLLGIKKSDVTELLAQVQEAMNVSLEAFQDYGFPPRDSAPQKIIGRINQMGSGGKAVEADKNNDGIITVEVGRSLAEEAMHTLFSSVTLEQQLKQSFQQGLTLFFGKCRGAIFLRQGSELKVFSEYSDAPELLQALALPVEQTASRIVSTFTQTEPHDLLLEGQDLLGGSIQDQQLLRLLGGRMVSCFPLVFSGRTQGVVAISFSEVLSDAWLKELLAAFASSLATVLQRVCRSREQQESLQAEFNETFQSRFGVLSHEVKNPLNIISNYLYLLGEKLDKDHPAQKDLSIISSETERIGKILNQSQSFVLDEDAGLVDINKIVSQQMSLVSAGLLEEKGALSVLNLQKSLPRIATDRDAMKQILVNLLKNAAEAVEAETGKVEVATFKSIHDDGVHYIGIEVKDNGSGISAEVHERLFQRVKSTKGGGHAGVGLSIVKELVHALHGHVFCKTSEYGTIFTVLLPHNEGDEARDK